MYVERKFKGWRLDPETGKVLLAFLDVPEISIDQAIAGIESHQAQLREQLHADQRRVEGISGDGSIGQPFIRPNKETMRYRETLSSGILQGEADKEYLLKIKYLTTYGVLQEKKAYNLISEDVLNLYADPPKKAIRILEPSQYMQMAIDMMKLSVQEKRTDGKISPQVGAVVVFPDGTAISACRGEMREGDHAEYGLLERKLPNQKLDECILFTTLEPCVKRNEPKKGCCKRITNARIKKVYVGLQDPDPTVAGDGIEHMERHGVKVVMFDREFQRIIEDENKEYLKQALRRVGKAGEDKKMSVIKNIVPSADFSQFSENALKKFITEAKLQFQITGEDFKRYLLDIGTMKLDDTKNVLRPTGVGILLFGNDPRTFYHQATLNATVDYGNGEIERVKFDQALVLIPDLVEAWLNKVLPVPMDTSSFKRKDKPNFPREVVREAVMNALMHRDYDLDVASCHLDVDIEKIVVKSPGQLLPSISMEQLNSFNAPSIRRNPILTYVFSLMDYVEESGVGMKILKSLNEKYGLPLPEYTYVDPHLVLTFPRTMKSVSAVSGIPALAELNEEELIGYEFVRLKNSITRKEYEEHFKFDTKKAERHVKKMVELGLLSREGSGPSTRYIVIPT